MKRNLILMMYLLSFKINYGQVSDSIMMKSEFRVEMSKMVIKVKMLEKNTSELLKAHSIQNRQVDSILAQLSIVQLNIQQIADSLHITVNSVSTTNIKTQGQINDIDRMITNRTFYWITGILLVALLSIIMFFALRSKLSLSTKNLDLQIEKTKASLQNEAIKLDSKLVEILQTQLTILRVEGKTNVINISGPDHKLPLKVGNEIYRMRQRIGTIKAEDKSLTPLSKSLERLEEEFNQGGYEIIEMLNKQYYDGLSVKATFIPSDSLNPGDKIITKIIKPQINFQHQAIQMAEIEVSTGN